MRGVLSQGFTLGYFHVLPPGEATSFSTTAVSRGFVPSHPSVARMGTHGLAD
jgi:hypothetical protein